MKQAYESEEFVGDLPNPRTRIATYNIWFSKSVLSY
jgi:hypothetical protein